ncbi:ThiF family adenylyltransferase [Paenibacillus sp. GCM10027627]|uniref:ThiF family adenylyltransferase n=1 Tax=unclassified Paenibacillus TaxID=185978 RepID=UPI003625EED0
MPSGGPAHWPDRYSRQTKFPPIGHEGQEKLREAKAVIVGCGALGASLAQHLVRAGVGSVTVADRDFVEPSNLQRQTLFNEADALAAIPKAVAAAEKLRSINSEVAIIPHVMDVNRHNAGILLAQADIVLDGTDNAAARLLLSDECYRSGIPFVYGGVAGAEGMSAVLVPGTTACLRCLIGDEQDGGDGDSCDIRGVLAPAVETAASLQAIEALKWLSGNRAAMRGTWVSFDLWHFGWKESRLPSPVEGCPQCSPDSDVPAGRTRRVVEQGQDVSVQSEPPSLPVALCGRNSYQVSLGTPLQLERLKERYIQLGMDLTSNRYLLKVHLNDDEALVLFPDGRVLVQGVSSPDAALSVCLSHVVEIDKLARTDEREESYGGVR